MKSLKCEKISRPVIGNQLRLLKLPHSVQRLLKRGDINKSICLLLLKLSEPKIQSHLADTIVKEALSVREAQTLIHRELTQAQEEIYIKYHSSRTIYRESCLIPSNNESKCLPISKVSINPQTICYECSNIDH